MLLITSTVDCSVTILTEENCCTYSVHSLWFDFAHKYKGMLYGGKNS